MAVPEPVLRLAQAQGEELADAEDEAAVQREALRDVADAWEGLLQVALAEDADVTGIGLLQADDGAQERGLPGAVRADEGDELPAMQVQVHPAQDGLSAERDAQIAHGDGDVSGGVAAGGVGHFKCFSSVFRFRRRPSS